MCVFFFLPPTPSTGNKIPEKKIHENKTTAKKQNKTKQIHSTAFWKMPLSCYVAK